MATTKKVRAVQKQSKEAKEKALTSKKVFKVQGKKVTCWMKVHYEQLKARKSQKDFNNLVRVLDNIL